MRIKNVLNVLLLSGLTLGTLSTVTSCKDYDDDIAGLKSDLTAETNARVALEKKVAAAESAIQALQSSVAGLQTDLKALQGDVKANKEAIAENEAAIVALQKAQAALQAALNDYATKKELSDAVVELNANIDKAIAAAKADLEAAINLKADKAEVAEQIQKVANDLTAVDTKYSVLPAQIAANAAEIEKLKTALEAQEKALEAANKAIADGDAATLAAAQKAIADAKKEITDAQKKITDVIDAAAKKAQADADKANASIDEVKASLANYATKGELEAIETQVTTIVNTNIKNVEDKVKALDAKIEVVSKALSNKLRSLVFMPYLYVDGIEAIEYPYYVDSTLIKVDVSDITRAARGTLIDGRKEVGSRKLSKLNDYVLKTPIEQFWVCPNWAIDYHMNPSTSTTQYKDIKGFNVLETKSITRANIANDYQQITSPEKYLDGSQLFTNNAGILSVGININEASLKAIIAQNGPKHIDQNGDGDFCDGQTGDVSYGKENIVALQVQAKDTVITSDYAMIYPEKIGVEGLIWNSYPGKFDIRKAAGLTGSVKVGKTVGDETGKTTGHWGANGCNEEIHVWNTPQEALLAAKDGSNLVEVAWNDEKGVELQKYLGIHVVRETVENKVKKDATKTFEKVAFTKKAEASDHKALTLGRLGLTYEFELIDYCVNDVTFDSRYAHIDAATGTIIAGNVAADGKTIAKGEADWQAESSVDREPLVRVIVKTIATDKVILDGYILCHIMREPLPVPEAEIKTIELETRDVNFDLCNAAKIYTLNWSEWSKWILTDDMKVDGHSMTKDEFTTYYKPDGTITNGPDSENTVWYTMNLYTDNKGTAVAYTGKINDDEQWGDVTVQWNEAGVQNHEIEWNMTENGLEYNSHDGKNGKEVWIRFNAVSEKAPYRYVYMKMGVNIARYNYKWANLSDKNENYWYNAFTGVKAANEAAAEGFIFNNKTPMNEKTLAGYDPYFGRNYLTSFDKNEMFVGAGQVTVGETKKADIAAQSIKDGATDRKIAKYFFLPIDIKVGPYTIIATSENVCPWEGVAESFTYADDVKYDRLYCKYHMHVDQPNCICDIHTNPWATANWHKHAGGTQVCTCKDFHALGLKTYAEYQAAGDFTAMRQDVETKFNNILSKCAIDYEKGVFCNNVLKVNGTTIAIMNQATGAIELKYNDVTKKVLNEIGWLDDNRTNIDKEMRALVAVARPNGCGVVMQAENNMFQISWERPLNLAEASKEAIDAKTNGNVIYLADVLNVYDFRGPVKGDMNKPENVWMWAYYMIDKITVDVTAGKVKADQDGKNTWDAEVNKYGELYSNIGHASTGEPIKGTSKGATTYRLDGTGVTGFNIYDYNLASKSVKLYDLMHCKNPLDHTDHYAVVGGIKIPHKEAFGVIYYDNNGTNVSNFKIKVPVTISYYWGDFTVEVEIPITGTEGNNDAKRK